jgi:hypothetical protein
VPVTLTVRGPRRQPVGGAVVLSGIVASTRTVSSTHGVQSPVPVSWARCVKVKVPLPGVIVAVPEAADCTPPHATRHS